MKDYHAAHNKTIMLLVVAALLGAAPAPTTHIYTGAGGCDVADADCTPPADPAGRQIATVSLTNSSRPEVSFTTTGGQPSWLQLSRDGRCLFAVQTDTSAIVSYSVAADALSGPVSTISSGGVNPVKLDLSATGDLLFVANYGAPTDGASAATLLVRPGCALDAADSVGFHRRSVDPQRQLNSHIHTVVADTRASTPSSTLLFAADLGGDAIYTLRATTPAGALSLVSTIATAAGSGPRHLAIHPSLRVAYVLFEMTSAIRSYSISADGALEALETDALPTVDEPMRECAGFAAMVQADVKSCSKAAEVVATPDGRSVFASNRGFGSPLTNTIAGFSVNATDGRLTTVDLKMSSATRFPRGMALARDGSTLFVAGQGSGNLVSLAVAPNGQPGKLGAPFELQTALPTPTTVAVAAPSNLNA